MRIPFSYGDIKLKLTPYNTKQEKEILLLSSMGSEGDIDDVLYILKDNIDHDIFGFSRLEKLMILMKMRSISVGDEINVKYQCTCGKINDTALVLPFPEEKEIETIFEGIQFENMVGKYTEASDYTSENLDELDLDKYCEIEEFVKDNFTKIDMVGSANCMFCGAEKNYNLDNDEYIIENMSEDTLLNIYTVISDMVYYSHYTKSDIDELIPFERTILFELLIKTKKENNS